MDIQKIIQELADDGSPAGVETEQDAFFSEPFDPVSISIEPRSVVMDGLIRRLRQGSIRLAPDFQRKFIWDISRCSRLIESLMLKIPLPMFYVAANDKGVWDVVDGLQRLTAIKNFILGPNSDGVGFKLVDLEFWGSRFNNKTYYEIANDQENARIINHIMESEMRFTVINPGTPEEVKRNIFKRINTGGMPLTPQEIRHALYQGNSTLLLSKMVDMECFRLAISGTINDTRMVARELVLRFLAFSMRDIDFYNSDMDGYLSDTMRVINAIPELTKENLRKIFKKGILPDIKIQSIPELVSRFEIAMTRGRALFGEHAFRKSCPPYARAPINKALFECIGNVLADVGDDKYNKLLTKKKIIMELYSKILNDANFERSIGRGSTSVTGVKMRYERISTLINEAVKEE